MASTASFDCMSLRDKSFVTRALTLGAMGGAAIYSTAGADSLHWGAAALMLLALVVSQRARVLGQRWCLRETARQRA